MSPAILACALALLPIADPQVPPVGAQVGKITTTPRKPHPLAPSLPELSDEEENKIEAIINRFIEADTGKLQGTEAKKALQDFQNLGPEATFALMRGMNKAAAIDHSCPAVTIARKLGATLSRTNDRHLLQYARENIGAGVTKSRHMGVLKDLKMTCTLRQTALGGPPP